MSPIFPQHLVTFGAGKFSLGQNISTFEEYIPLIYTYHSYINFTFDELAGGGGVQSQYWYI